MKKYRALLFKDGGKTFFVATWSKEKDAERGDCFVRAIHDEVEIPKKILGTEVYATEPMYLIDIRKNIETNKLFMGTNVGRCVGISLEDEEERKIPFFPIPVDQ